MSMASVRSRILVLPLLAVLLALNACAFVRDTPPADIVTAQILPAVAPPPIPPERPAPPLVQAPVEVQSTLAVLPPRKPIHRRAPRPHPAPVEAPSKPVVVEAPPAAPPPVISVQVLRRDQARGLLDAQVQRPNGRVVGRAVDAVADSGGKPRDIVINLVGFMGIGDRKVIVPWSAVSFDPTAVKAPFTLKADAKERAVGATSSGLPAVLTSPLNPTPAPGGINLLDATVYAMQGRDIGRVVDVLVDAEGTPRAVVIDISGSVIHDEHRIAANWSTLHIVTKGTEMRLMSDLTEKQIAAAPPYESGKPAQVVSPWTSGADPGDTAKADAPAAPPATASVARSTR